jgi:hypothetical protein
MSQADRKTGGSSRFPLRLMPSVRKNAETFSQKEGVSLNQFINIAVAEKLAHLQHDEWLAQRPEATPATIARALAALDRQEAQAPEPGDELPQGYVSVLESAEYRAKSAI